MARKVPFSRDYRRFCRLLKDARKSAGFTQHSLAKLLRRPQSYVSKYELAERRLDVIEFLRICKTLSLDPAQLLAQIR
jgi:transcriptional regulator with XRE-family HTH domain